MSYCRKCGAKLDEEARFCRVCGTPVAGAAAAPPSAPMERRSGRPFLLPAAILVGILVAAFFFAVVAFVPFQTVNFTQSNSAPAVSGVNAVNLNFDADVANVNVILRSLPDQLVVVDISAKGSTGLFGSATNPVQVTFSNQTAGKTLTVTSKVSRQEMWPMSYNLNVVCNVYVDPVAVLNLTVRTSVGEITMNSIDAPAVLQALNLHTTTGSVRATVTDLVVFAGDVSVSTTTGNVQFTWNNAHVSGDILVNLRSTTGSVTADVTQNRLLAGNVSLDATTTTGAVNLGIDIDDNVGAEVTSHATFGGITVDAQNFNGNKSPIYSSNYPAVSNFRVNLGTTTGGIHVTAVSQTPESSVQEQVRDATMTYIRANHPETAQFMNNLSAWTGGREDTGLLGAETYIYNSTGWTVTIKYPVIPNPVYTITADYSATSTQGASIPYRVIWEGTWENGSVTETSYTFAQ